MLKRFYLWMARNQTRAELNALSDRELRDLGIGRGDIPRIVAEIQ